jgi:hypothetical protein
MRAGVVHASRQGRHRIRVRVVQQSVALCMLWVLDVVECMIVWERVMMKKCVVILVVFLGLIMMVMMLLLIMILPLLLLMHMLLFVLLLLLLMLRQLHIGG